MYGIFSCAGGKNNVSADACRVLRILVNKDKE
jgi:hypothetical protein